MTLNKQRFLVGVDEVGRGPLAGPVAVGVAMVPVEFDWTLLPGVRDSKALKPKDREAIFRLASNLRLDGVIDWKVSMTGETIIDKIGIVPSIDTALRRSLTVLERRYHTVNRMITAPLSDLAMVKLDGGLKAPAEYAQETIIKGDATERVIGLASILAKVTRDRYMTRMSTQYPAYGFEIHKGYGTKKHCDLIREHGLSEIHRVTFCRNLQKLKLVL